MDVLLLFIGPGVAVVMVLNLRGRAERLERELNRI